MAKAKSGVTVFIDVQGFFKEADEIILTEAIKLAKLASDNSAVGVTGQFKQSWKAFSVRNGCTVINVVDYARQALVGISPQEAKSSNADTLKALAKWVDVVLDVDDPDKALLIARAILRKHKESGSQRWRTRSNFLDLDPKTLEPRPGSPVLDTARAITERINKLTL